MPKILPRSGKEGSPTNRLRLLRNHSRFVGAQRKLLLCYMRLPQPLLDSPFFQFERLADLERAIGEFGHEDEIAEVRRLAGLNLPPIASSATLATLLGINRGLIWSFVNRPRKHYRTYFIPKGRDQRRIDAPRVALKIPQKWIATQLGRHYEPPPHVFGFVPNRSHINAARVHVRASWVLSLDIQDFFPTTPQSLVEHTLLNVGYREPAARLIASIACFNGALAQGAPSSPSLSNYCFEPWDRSLSQLAEHEGVRLSRYADDIVFSGTDTYPDGLQERAIKLLEDSPWRISERKISLVFAPARLKVHGLLVHEDNVRLTKGYRNKIRALRHLVATRTNLDAKFLEKAQGHLSYARSVDDD